MNGAETFRVQEHSYASQEPSAEGDQIGTLSDESEDSENTVHRSIRMLRKFPEESEELSDEQHQALTPTSRTTCICPEVLNKATLVAIIGSLAFLGFFSTLVLLLAAIVILRVMDKQSKKEKRERKDTDSTKRPFSRFLRRQKESLPPSRPIPPIPLRPSERVYLSPLPVPKYDTHPVGAAEGTYVDPQDLHPGPPRFRQEAKYGSAEGTRGEIPSTPENAYSRMDPVSHFSTSTPENAYVSMHQTPHFSTSTPENAYTNVLPAPLFSTPSPEHVYTSIPSPQAEHSYAPVDESQFESMADASGDQTKGPEEHVYEEIE